MNTFVRLRSEKIRFFKFLTVGLLGAIIDFGVMNLLSRFYNFPLTIAGSISFICAVISNFFWNRHWTYPESRTRPIVTQLLMFFAVNLMGMGIRYPILKILEDIFLKAFLHWSIYLPNASFLAKNMTLGIAMGVVLLWNFFINRYWTYNDIDKVDV